MMESIYIYTNTVSQGPHVQNIIELRTSLMLMSCDSPVKVCMWDENGYEPSKMQNIFRVEGKVLPCQDFQTWKWVTVNDCHAKKHRGQNIFIVDCILDTKLDCLPFMTRRLKQPVSFQDHIADCWSILPLLVHPLHEAGRPDSCVGSRCPRHGAGTSESILTPDLCRLNLEISSQDFIQVSNLNGKILIFCDDPNVYPTNKSKSKLL